MNYHTQKDERQMIITQVEYKVIIICVAKLPRVPDKLKTRLRDIYFYWFPHKNIFWKHLISQPPAENRIEVANAGGHLPATAGSWSPFTQKFYDFLIFNCRFILAFEIYCLVNIIELLTATTSTPSSVSVAVSQQDVAPLTQTQVGVALLLVVVGRLN